MRAWGRTYDELGNATWVVVETDANGFNDGVMIVCLAQVLKLNLGESPFFGNYGIPQHQSVMTRVYPDYYVNVTKKQFTQYFASLQVTKIADPYPAYQINVITQQGSVISAKVPT